jgi:DNA-binding winged helix-turn-helix (wHTH) protein/tetratricopeptide (TPR) repeat protein
MSEDRLTPRPVRFGEIEVDLRAGEVKREGLRISLGEQPRRILSSLVERAGDLVTRDELRRELWRDNTYVDFEHGLNSAIKRLRDALGDAADTPRYIETVPRRGYRLIAPVEVHPPSKPGASDRQGAPLPIEGTTSRRTAAYAVVGFLVVTGVAGWLTVWTSGSRSATQPFVPAAVDVENNLVAVAAFENRTTHAALDSLGALAADRIIRGVSVLDNARVVAEAIRLPGSEGTSRAQGTISSLPAAGAIDRVLTAARAAGAALAIAGHYYQHEDRLEFHARVLDARTGEPLFIAAPVTCGRAEPEPALDTLEQVIAGAVGIHFDQAFGGLEHTSHAPLLDAYLEYQAGRDVFASHQTRAVTHLKRSLDISPEFFLPKLTLAMAYGNLGDSASLAREMARIADGANRLTRSERLLWEYLSESLAHRPASAMRALRDAEALVPDSAIVNYSIMMEALILNQPSIAIDAFDRLPLHPRYGRFNGWRLRVLARALHDLGDYQRELKEVKRARTYDPGSLIYAANEARALAALGQVADVHAVIDESLAVPATDGSPGVVMEHAAKELRVHGYRASSLDVAARAVRWYRGRPQALAGQESSRAALARVLYLSERWGEAAELAAELAADHPDSVEYTGFLGAIAARQGQSSRALEISETLRNIDAPDLFGRHTYWRACIAALLGDKERAVALLREALGQGEYRGLRLHQDPHLEALRDFAPFVELTRPQREARPPDEGSGSGQRPLH